MWVRSTWSWNNCWGSPLSQLDHPFTATGKLIMIIWLIWLMAHFPWVGIIFSSCHDQASSAWGQTSYYVRTLLFYFMYFQDAHEFYQVLSSTIDDEMVRHSNMLTLILLPCLTFHVYYKMRYRYNVRSDWSRLTNHVCPSLHKHADISSQS